MLKSYEPYLVGKNNPVNVDVGYFCTANSKQYTYNLAKVKVMMTPITGGNYEGNSSYHRQFELYTKAHVKSVMFSFEG